MEYGHSNINMLIDYFDQEEALKEFAVPYATTVKGGIPDLEGDFAKNQLNQLVNSVDSPEASIQQNPAYDAKGNLKYKGGLGGSFINPLDLIPGGSLIGALGKFKNTPSIIKQMMRGGQKMKTIPGKTQLDQLLDLSKKYRVQQPKEFKNMMEVKKGSKYLDNVQSSNRIDDIVKYNAESEAAMSVEKALGRHKGTYSNPAYDKRGVNAVPFEIIDDMSIDEGKGVWDAITYYLELLSKN